MGVLPFLIFFVVGSILVYILKIIYNTILDILGITPLDTLILSSVNVLHNPYFHYLSIVMSISYGLFIGGGLGLILHPDKKVTEKGGLLFGIGVAMMIAGLIAGQLIDYVYVLLGLLIALGISVGAYVDSKKYVEEIKIKISYPIKVTLLGMTLLMISLCVFSLSLIFNDLTIYNVYQSSALFLFYLIMAGILLKLSNFDIRRSETKYTPKASFIVGHQNSGKTVLGVGLYKIATDEYGGDLIASKPISVSSKKHYETITNILAYMIAEGKYYRGTEKSEFIINAIEIQEDFDKKLIFGKENLLISFVDYGGEYLDDVSKIITQNLLDEYVDELINILSDEGVDKNVISKIKSDAKSLNFDYLKYKINWRNLPEKHLKYSAPLYIMSNIKNSKKLIFLIDGKRLLPLLIQINPELALRLKRNDEKLYDSLSNSETRQFLNDIANYISIITSKKLKVYQKPVLFVITKADEIIRVYGKMVGRNYSDVMIKYEKEVYDEIKDEIMDLLLDIDHIRQLIRSLHKDVKDLKEYVKMSAIIPQKGKLIVLGVDDIIEWLKK